MVDTMVWGEIVSLASDQPLRPADDYLEAYDARPEIHTDSIEALTAGTGKSRRAHCESP